MTPTRWLVGVRTLDQPARSLRVVPAVDEEVAIAAQLMIDGGDDIVYVFLREVTTAELAPVLARGDSIMETFGTDIDNTLYFAEGAR